jgi:hypothetical protein
MRKFGPLLIMFIGTTLMALNGEEKVLIVADPLGSEAAGVAEVFPDSVVYSPSQFRNSSATWPKRNLLYLGTEALLAKNAIPDFAAAAQVIPNVIVASPLAKVLDSFFERELGRPLETMGTLNEAMRPGFAIQQMGLSVNYRYYQGFNLFKFYLRATLTPSSSQPLYLKAIQGCHYALGIDYTEERDLAPSPRKVPDDYQIMIRCERSTARGVLVVAGFELPDLDTTAPALENLSKFIRQVLKR